SHPAAVLVLHIRNRYRAMQCYIQLLAQLAHQCLYWCLAGFYLPAGEFPLQWRRIGSASLADQQPAVLALTNRGYNQYAHAPAPENSFTIRKISRAPSTSAGPGVFNSSS